MSGSVNTTHGHIDHVFPNWISVDFKLPEESGEYLCCIDNERINVLPYSNKHKVFNAYDSQDIGFVIAMCLPVTHWMPLPPLPEDSKPIFPGEEYTFEDGM